MATNSNAAALDESAVPVPDPGHEQNKQHKQTIDPYNVCCVGTAEEMGQEQT